MFQFSIVVQLLLASLAYAAPVANDVTAAGHGDAWQYGTGGGVIGLIVLILDVLVFIEVLKSNRPPSSKIIWCLVVFLFPVLGMLIYYLFSNREAHKSGGYETLP